MWILHRENALRNTAEELLSGLRDRGLDISFEDTPDASPGALITHTCNNDIEHLLADLSDNGKQYVLVVHVCSEEHTHSSGWRLLNHGAADVLAVSNPLSRIDDIAARLSRAEEIETILNSEWVRNRAAGTSLCWRKILRRVIEIACHTNASCLATGESGTGKELIARLVHDLDSRRKEKAFVTVDCTTLSPELAGSELFGHTKGAFTNAISQREGAFSLANGGTLFLDEIGELPLPLQAQLLRAIQEKIYKRIGDNVWQTSDFRLICATNRNLEEEVRCGRFRSDLYYRIAQWHIRMPSLADRREDIPALVEHFLFTSSFKRKLDCLDNAMRQHLFNRSYPGNVRELKNIVQRILDRHGNMQHISLGALPEEFRPEAEEPSGREWMENLGPIIEDAICIGTKLKDIGAMAETLAIKAALRKMNGNLSQAANLLGVTPRALQIRRASERRGVSPANDVSEADNVRSIR
ncbi:MAG TPA: sigma 54-interacting transcriptional regulator [Gallionella sp.]|nr:sigma 54-interacting transcriptional regulator [Gallionella sp.]